jgi:hypothetical protein
MFPSPDTRWLFVFLVAVFTQRFERPHSHLGLLYVLVAVQVQDDGAILGLTFFLGLAHLYLSLGR